MHSWHVIVYMVCGNKSSISDLNAEAVFWLEDHFFILTRAHAFHVIAFGDDAVVSESHLQNWASISTSEKACSGHGEDSK